MGRSKPRTNKRPPPKPSRANGSAGTSPVQPSAPAASVVGHAHHHHHSPAPIHFDPVSSLFPPPSTLDPTDPNFPAAFQSWSTSALNQINQLGQLPRLTPAQLSAIAGAAAGMSDGGLLAAAGQEDCVGLPQSLAGLFEAKLTLDREKTKLQRVQKELSGFRDGNWSAAGPAPVGAPPPMPTIKGKEVAALVADDDDLAECTCGRNGRAHEYPGSAHSGSDDYYYYDTEDDCCECCSHDHSYIECDHEPGECDCEEYDEVDEHAHHHHHHHHHHDGEVDSDADEYEYADGRGHGHGHSCGHGHGHGHEYDAHDQGHGHTEGGGFEALVLGPDGHPANLTPDQAMALFGDANAAGGLVRGLVPPPGYLNSPEARAILARHAAKQQEVLAAKQVLAGVPGWAEEHTEGHGNGDAPRRRLADDPERMDEAVRELFNWIKAVVWTIEQAAIVAGRRAPLRPQRRAPGDGLSESL